MTTSRRLCLLAAAADAGKAGIGVGQDESELLSNAWLGVEPVQLRLESVRYRTRAAETRERGAATA